MSKRALSFLFCVLLVGFITTWALQGPSSDPTANEIPDDDWLRQYNQSIVEIESEKEFES